MRGLASYAPVVGGVVGLITSFIGGKKEATPKEPLVFNGSLELVGTTKEVAPLACITFIFKKGPLTTQDYRPVSDRKWGIFNLKTQPVYSTKIKYLINEANGTMTSYQFSPPIQHILNHDLNITSVKIAKVYSNKKPSNCSTKPSHGISPHLYLNKIGTIYGSAPDIVNQNDIEITIKNNSAKYFRLKMYQPIAMKKRILKLPQHQQVYTRQTSVKTDTLSTGTNLQTMWLSRAIGFM